jgi:hypothetical protein
MSLQSAVALTAVLFMVAGGFLQISMIGVERKPITRTSAMCGIVINILLIAGIAFVAGWWGHA